MAVAAVALIAAVAAVVLLAGGVLGGDEDPASQPARTQRATSPPATDLVRALDPLPRRDQANGYMDLNSLDGAITLAAGHPQSGDPGVSDWAVYAIAGRDARQACDEVTKQWINGMIGLSDDFTNDPDRARALTDNYRTTPGGCTYSFLENSPSSPDLGPARWDIAVRAFVKGDRLTHDPRAVRSLGAITPLPAPIYEGPYSEVSIARVQQDVGQPFADGRLAADLKPKPREAKPSATAVEPEHDQAMTTVRCDANITVSDGTCAFANNAFWTYWTQGQPMTMSVYDPDSGAYQETYCESSEQVDCITDSGIQVTFAQSAVDVYDQRQADRYAATHKVG